MMHKFTIKNHTIKIKFCRFLQNFAEMVRNYADLWSIAHHKQIMIQHYKVCKCKCLYISIYQYLIENGEYDKNLVRIVINCTPQANHKTTLYKLRNTLSLVHYKKTSNTLCDSSFHTRSSWPRGYVFDFCGYVRRSSPMADTRGLIKLSRIF